MSNILLFDPSNNCPYVDETITDVEYRQQNGVFCAWLFNPYTGTLREATDVGSDVQGVAIVPPEVPLYTYIELITMRNAYVSPRG